MKLTVVPVGMTTVATLAKSGTTPVRVVLLVKAQLVGLNQSPVVPPTQVTESRCVISPDAVVLKPALLPTASECNGLDAS